VQHCTKSEEIRSEVRHLSPEMWKKGDPNEFP